MDISEPFSITICGLEELPGHCTIGVSHVLSILDPQWPVPEAFGAFGEHAKLELRFHDVIDEHGGESYRAAAGACKRTACLWAPSTDG